MFVVTFYSFKGGVGRTQSLANIAYHIASQGKKVLVVDFDLEAPGLDSLFERNVSVPGVLDYVDEFIKTNTSPDASKYCFLYEKFDSSGELYVMPSSYDYSDKTASLAKIDWHDLYKNKNGFLMIEDLKAQWRESLKFDYVFIDSRTGHTDVEGICTRHLPDLLVMMFYPNHQNRRGISVVNSRVSEYEKDTKNKIRRVYVASNVPNIDDENEVLSRILNEFESSLGDIQIDHIIHHYESLNLLDKPLFVKDRINTRLAKEYKALSASIRKKNIQDEFGATATVRELIQNQDEELPRGINKTLEDIQKYHSNNLEVLRNLSTWYNRRGDIDDAVSLLDKAINLGGDGPVIRIQHARLSSALGNKEAAMRDLEVILNSDGVNYNVLNQIVRLSQRHGFNSILNRLPGSPAVNSQAPFELLELVESLSDSREELLICLDILDKYENKDIIEEDFIRLQHRKANTCIGLGLFKEALRILSLNGRPSDKSEIDVIFNYSMAEWGLKGEIPTDLMLMVYRQAMDMEGEQGYDQINFNQCLALVCWAIGKKDEGLIRIGKALHLADIVVKKQFSCWSYLNVAGRKLREELEAIKRLLLGHEEKPLFLLVDKDLFLENSAK